MKIEKVLNNNVVVALDENGAETVLMGRGLGFGRRAGDEAPPDKVEKRFTLHSDQLSDRFQQLITSIPLPHFLMSERIINHAKIALGKELSDSIYVTLPDHISAAVNRYKEGIVLPNPLLWDIRQLYKDEFRVGLKANEIVKEETGVEFTDDEAAFIALHFVNAQLGGEIRDIYDMTYLLKAVFGIVYDEYGFRPDDESLNYYRFVTHLKFYARRIVSGEGYGDEDSDGAAALLGLDRGEVLRVLSMLHAVSGRFEKIRAANGTTAIVDYAHTPDALENVIQTIEEIRTPGQQLIVVCGCGGDRDRTKRPEMAAIAVKYATTAVFTSDNPRHESPEAILDDMVAGLEPGARYLRIADRAEAIRTAVMLSRPGDIILVAGKGHETYQIVGDVKHPFDDREEIKKHFALLN